MQKREKMVKGEDDSHFLHVAWNAFGDGAQPSLGTVDLQVVTLALLGTAPQNLVVQSGRGHKDQHCHQEHHRYLLHTSQHPVRRVEGGQASGVHQDHDPRTG